MIRVGAVNIDTSHPMGFAKAMAEDGRMRYVGVYNDSFRSEAEVAGFVQRFGLEKRCDTPEELASLCDIAFIQGCDWDEHLRLALPFIKRGKAVFIDKPIVGNLADCRQLLQLARAVRPWLRHVHVKDVTYDEKGEPVCVCPGRGLVAWPALLACLQKDGYDGWLSLEPHYRVNRRLTKKQMQFPSGSAFSAGGSRSGG